MPARVGLGCETSFGRGSVGPISARARQLGGRVEIARWDELQLVQRCKDGSEAAFAELVRRYRPRLFTLAYRLTADRETAEDVVQETFVAAFRALDRFEPRPSLAAWLNTIAVRNAGRGRQPVTQRPASSLDAMLDDDARHQLAGRPRRRADPQRAAEAAEVRREVADAIAALPFKYRAAVVTRYVLGLDYAEAAASLEMGLNTYKSHLLRGTRMLRDALAVWLPGVAGARRPGEEPDVPSLRPAQRSCRVRVRRPSRGRPVARRPAAPNRFAATRAQREGAGLTWLDRSSRNQRVVFRVALQLFDPASSYLGCESPSRVRPARSCCPRADRRLPHRRPR